MQAFSRANSNGRAAQAAPQRILFPLCHQPRDPADHRDPPILPDNFAWIARRRAFDEWSKTEVGRLFVEYENITDRTWRVGSGLPPVDDLPELDLSVLTRRQSAARWALIKAIGGPDGITEDGVEHLDFSKPPFGPGG